MTGFGTKHVILSKQHSAQYFLRTGFGQDSFATIQFTILICMRKNSAVNNQTIEKTMKKTTVTNAD